MKKLNFLKSATLQNLQAKEVWSEVSFTRGLPSFNIVGLASESIKESKERVKSALLHNNFTFPPLRILISLSPSDLQKSGSHFDLPIAVLIALKEFVLSKEFEDFFVFGELGLDGTIKDTNAIFPIVLSLAQKHKNLNVLTSIKSAQKLSKIPNIKIYALSSLNEAVSFFKKEKTIQPYPQSSIQAKKITILNKDYFYEENFELDFKDVLNQQRALRATLIASAGMHNILFNGTPGSGKSMIAKRIPYILPPLSIEEILEIATIKSIEQQEIDFKASRLLFAPHHSSSRASIFGGGSANVKPGVVALANNGVLFFDEIPHFQSSVLEALREPLENNKILITRVNAKVEYKTNFLFVGAQNPCPCGYLFSNKKECRCNELEIKRYNSKISGPILDRIDLYVEMDEVNLKEKGKTVSSKELFEKVLQAFRAQKQRGQKNFNAKLDNNALKQYCQLDKSSQEIIQKATNNLALSMRGINKIIKIARTIADLEESTNIKQAHILEAISFRYR